MIGIWQQVLNRRELTSEEGEPIEIIYPGRANDDKGADFRDAVVATGGRLAKGDIEVHVRSSDWRAHRHHQNSAYNRVILHVVMWHDNNQATRLQDGRCVPIVVLQDYIGTRVSQRSRMPDCSAVLRVPCFRVTEHLSEYRVAAYLDGAGEERFLVKAADFQRGVIQMGAGQCLYRGVMGALGYAKNKLPCLELADRLPLRILEAIAQREISEKECIAEQQALLLGAAGLLPSQRRDRHRESNLDDRWVEKLERIWNSSRCTEVMSPGAWQVFKVRPNNSPVRRLVAMSYLIPRYRERGMLEGLLDVVGEAPLRGGWDALEQGLVVTTDGYWASRFDFGSGSRMVSRALLGSRRAADIIVNVLLPFIFAWGQSNSKPELARKAIHLYCHYPRLAVNSVERHMRNQLGLSTGLVNSAQRQQGLIHIYNTLCTQGRCNSCPLKPA